MESTKSSTQSPSDVSANLAMESMRASAIFVLPCISSLTATASLVQLEPPIILPQELVIAILVRFSAMASVSIAAQVLTKSSALPLTPAAVSKVLAESTECAKSALTDTSILPKTVFPAADPTKS